MAAGNAPAERALVFSGTGLAMLPPEPALSKIRGVLLRQKGALCVARTPPFFPLGVLRRRRTALNWNRWRFRPRIAPPIGTGRDSDRAYRRQPIRDAMMVAPSARPPCAPIPAASSPSSQSLRRDLRDRAFARRRERCAQKDTDQDLLRPITTDHDLLRPITTGPTPKLTNSRSDFYHVFPPPTTQGATGAATGPACSRKTPSRDAGLAS